MRRAQLLRQLVLDSHYVIDEHLVAAAILARAATRLVLADASFRNDIRGPRAVRSVWPHGLRALFDRRRAPGLAGPV